MVNADTELFPIRSAESMMQVIRETGIIPFSRNRVRGWSIEEMTHPYNHRPSGGAVPRRTRKLRKTHLMRPMILFPHYPDVYMDIMMKMTLKFRHYPEI